MKQPYKRIDAFQLVLSFLLVLPLSLESHSLLAQEELTPLSDQPPEDTMDEDRTPREAAPIDLTGYWTTVITEDWRWRMVVPPHGDYTSMPLNAEGIRVADTWDPESDTGTCRPYGAANLMRMPIRVHLEWEDDDTLILESDHGMQTRYLHFNPAEARSDIPTLQGDSVAEWDGESLKVTTTNLTGGYLRRNGVPYSPDAVVTEYYDRHASYGDEWFTVSTLVDDPTYLTRVYYTSSSFKQLPDGSDWNPVPCGNDSDT